MVAGSWWQKKLFIFHTIIASSFSISKQTATMVDCGCPDTCDASALAEKSAVHSWTCGERIEEFMTGGFPEKTACTMTVGEGLCAACNPEQCKKTAETKTATLLPESSEGLDSWAPLTLVVMNVLIFLIIAVVIIKRRGRSNSSSHKKSDTTTSAGVFKDDTNDLELSRPYTDQHQPRNIPSNEVFQVQKGYLAEHGFASASDADGDGRQGQNHKQFRGSIAEGDADDRRASAAFT